MARVKMDVVAYGPETAQEVITDLLADVEGNVDGRITGVYVAGGNPEVEFVGPWRDLVKVLARGLDEDKRNHALWQLVDLVQRIQTDENEDASQG